MRQVRSVGSGTNHVTIGTDWDALSDEAVAHAIASGWWSAQQGRFDFAAAYRDTSWVPPTFSSGRYRRTCEMLADGRSSLTEGAMRAALRDHYGSSVYRPIHPAEDERYLSVCMHADPIGSTTAAAVVALPNEPRRPIRYWACLGAPCVGIFVPLYIAGTVPAILARGGLEPSEDSPWWRFRRLLELVETDHEKFGSLVRNEWDRDESALAEEADRVERELAEDPADPAPRLTDFMDRSVDRVLTRLTEITAKLS
jgi:dipeptidase